MNHLAAFAMAKPVPYLCYCLSLEPDAPPGHTSQCPFLCLAAGDPPLDLKQKIIDPTRFTVFELGATGVAGATGNAAMGSNFFSQPVFTQKDPGFTRIDTFVSVLNFIRTNVQGCTVFYTVTDTLLRHMYAQLLPVIVGDIRFNASPEKYLFYAKLTPVPVRLFVTTARQIGKTTTMAVVLAALICVADGMDLAKIYARTQNQAVNLLSEVKSIFHRIPAHLKPVTILKMNETTVSVLSLQNGLPCTLQAAPGNIEGIRGHKPRVIVVDEYQFTLPEFWTQHIWALCQVVDRVLICASTPGEPGSYMAAETQKMKNSPQLYSESRVLDFSLVCQKHRDEDTPLLCRCKLDLLPPWKNVAAIRIAQGQYGDGNTGDFIQEVLGEPVSSGTRIFDPKLLATAFNAEQLTLHGQPQGNVIYVAIDPSGGGDSELAIASIVYTADSRLLVIGLESALTKKMGAVDVSNFVRQHLRLLRGMYVNAMTTLPSSLRNAVFIPIVEDQGGVPMAQTICDIFREPEFQPSLFLVGHRVDASCRSDGVPTTRPIKENMVFLCETLLKEDRLKIATHLLSTGIRNIASGGGGGEAGIGTAYSAARVARHGRESLKLLHTQLGALFYDDKKHITGKLGPGFKDDLAMALFLAIYWSNRLRTTTRSLVSGQVVYDPYRAML
jgi:hypothetical protein